LHNQGLEFIFKEIKAQGIEFAKKPKLKGHSFINEIDESFIKQSTLNFCKQNKMLKEYSKTIERDILSQVKLKSSHTESYSSDLQDLLKELNVVLRKKFDKDEIPKLKEQLDVINSKASKTLSTENAAVFYCASSTGYHSYIYWMRNYKKWYFAMHYPEILEQYKNDELNELQLKNGGLKTKGWWSDVWNTAEDWWNSASGAIVDWWDDGGAELVAADVSGAGEGAMYGLVIAVNTGTAAWGAIPTGAVAGGVYNSAGHIIETWIIPNEE
jgi:hypothetical protein